MSTVGRIVTDETPGRPEPPDMPETPSTPKAPEPPVTSETLINHLSYLKHCLPYMFDICHTSSI